jgi:hypothetical protein
VATVTALGDCTVSPVRDVGSGGHGDSTAEDSMKDNRVVLVMSLLLLTMAPSLYAAQCSSASVAGRWAFTTNGSITGVGPVAAVGSYIADTSGNLAGSQTRSLNGEVADETFTGTSTVHADCTGTDTIQVFEKGVLVRTSILNVVYYDNGRGVQAIFRSLVLPDGTSLPTILTIDAKRIFPEDED